MNKHIKCIKPFFHPIQTHSLKEEFCQKGKTFRREKTPDKLWAIQEVDHCNITRDIVVGLFRLAGIEEDEDLLFACVSDVRYIPSILVVLVKV